MNQLSQQFTPSDTNEGENTCENTDDNTESQCSENCSEECKAECKAYCNEECESNDKKNNTKSKQEPQEQQESQQPQIFNNKLFGDLAEEIGKTFNFDEMEKDGKPKNIGEALGKFMSGNNPAKLMELVGKFGGKLQDEVKKGNINPADLLKQTMSVAGGGQNIQNILNNPKMQQQMKQMQKQSATPTKDRLRAKLDKKNADKTE
jgi:hypothetical protein